MAILMHVDGVLRDKRRRPIPYGFKLMEALKDRRKVILLCSDYNETDMWLRLNNIYKSHELLDYNLPSPKDDPDYRRVEYLQSCGPVDCVITADPDLVNKVAGSGMNALLFNPAPINDYDIDYVERSDVSWEAVIKELQAFPHLPEQ